MPNQPSKSEPLRKEVMPLEENGRASQEVQNDPLHFEDLLAEMSAAFVRVTPDRIELERWLERIGLALRIDRVAIAEISPKDRKLYVTHQWAREGVIPTPLGLDVNAALPWLAAKVMVGETVVVSREEELPPEASEDLKWGRRAGFKSNLTIPFKVGGVIMGGVGVDCCFRQRTWSPRIIRRLSMIADIFGGALERQAEAAETQRLNDDIDRLSRVTMMGQLTASLAHELNQPLGAILSNAQAARRHLTAKRPDLKEIGAAIEDIIRDNSRAAATIRNVRSLFQQGELKVSPVDLRQILHDVERIVRADAMLKHITFRLDLPASLPTVMGNKAHLVQALINLTSNAFDSVCESGNGLREVVIRATQHETARVHVAVRDSGKGIDPKIMPKLFDSFFTTKPKGMGMGLAIVRAIIEHHGGRLWATPNPDGGATLEFELPVKVDLT